MRAVKYVLSIALAAAGLLWASLGIETGTNLPAHAMLLVNSSTNTYVTVPCIIRGNVDRSYVANVEAVIEGTEEAWYEPFVEVMTKGEAQAIGMKPDRSCANAHGFIFWQPWLFDLVGGGRKRVADDGTVLW